MTNVKTVQAIITIENGETADLLVALRAFNKFNVNSTVIVAEKVSDSTLELKDTASGETLVQKFANGDVLHTFLFPEDWEEGEPER